MKNEVNEELIMNNEKRNNPRFILIAHYSLFTIHY